MDEIDSVRPSYPAVTDDEIAYLEPERELGGRHPAVCLEDCMAVVQEGLDDQSCNGLILDGDDDIAAAIAGSAGHYLYGLGAGDIREWQAAEEEHLQYSRPS